MFSKASYMLLMCQNEYLWSKGLTLQNHEKFDQSKFKALADNKNNIDLRIEICF